LALPRRLKSSAKPLAKSGCKVFITADDVLDRNVIKTDFIEYNFSNYTLHPSLASKPFGSKPKNTKNRISWPRFLQLRTKKL
jgi:hypothetical protein